MKKYIPIILVLAVLATVVIIIVTKQNTAVPTPTVPVPTVSAPTAPAPTVPVPTVSAPTAPTPTQASVPMDSAVGAFSTQDLEGNAVDTGVFSSSKLTLINVWATYCPPCKAEIPDLGKLDKEIEDFQVLGILIDAGVKGFPDQANLDLGKKIISDSGAEYANILPDLKLIDKFLTNVYAVPTSIFVDEKGQKVGEEIVGSKSYDDWKTEIVEKLAQVNAG